MQIPQEAQRPEHWPPETERCSNTSDMFQEEKPQQQAHQEGEEQ